MTKKEAKKLYLELKKQHLISKPKWDYMVDGYDWKCLGCNYGWLSNPDIGYVRTFEVIATNRGILESILMINQHTFRYKGQRYFPCGKHEYHQLTWYNKKEYEEYCNKCSDIQFPAFEELWEKIQKNTNDTGGKTWRSLQDSYDIILNEKYNFIKNKENYEKVVTLGYHQTIPKGSIECPVCKDMYDLFSTGFCPLNIFQKIREFIYREVGWRLRRIIYKKIGWKIGLCISVFLTVFFKKDFKKENIEGVRNKKRNKENLEIH